MRSSVIGLKEATEQKIELEFFHVVIYSLSDPQDFLLE